MSKSNTFENAFLLLVFNNTNVAGIGDATGLRGSAVAGDLYVSWHTADPGEGGNQGSNEATYPGYARTAVPRTPAGWTVTDNSVSPTVTISSPTCSGGSETVTHFGIGTDASGAGLLLFSGSVTPQLVVTVGVTPQLLTSTTITED